MSDIIGNIEAEGVKSNPLDYAFDVWLNGETTSNIYNEEYKKIDRLLTFINFISYLFPITITSILLYSKQNNDNLLGISFKTFEIVSFWGSFLIMIIGLASVLLMKAESRKEEYIVGFRNNLQISREAKRIFDYKLLSEIDLLKKMELMQDQYDAPKKPRISEKRKHKSYRDFLIKHNFSCQKCNFPNTNKPILLRDFFKTKTKCLTCGNIDLQ